MKNIRELNKNLVYPSQDNTKCENPHQIKENSSLNRITYQVLSNRWGVETGKNTITSGSQSSSKSVVADSDLGSENFRNQSAASQTGIARFQETRFLSPMRLKRKAIDALKRVEEQRKEQLRFEEENEEYSEEEI